MVLDVLRLLAKGSDAAKEAGKKLLSGMLLALWRRGLDDSPAQALPVSCRGCAPTIGVAACLSIYSNRLVSALDAAAWAFKPFGGAIAIPRHEAVGFSLRG
jgi:hypothetical protein